MSYVTCQIMIRRLGCFCVVEDCKISYYMMPEQLMLELR